MKLEFYKSNNIIKVKVDENSEIVFTNLNMIDALYKGEEINLSFRDNFTDREKDEITKFFNEIKKKVDQIKNKE